MSDADHVSCGQRRLDTELTTQNRTGERETRVQSLHFVKLDPDLWPAVLAGDTGFQLYRELPGAKR